MSKTDISYIIKAYTHVKARPINTHALHSVLAVADPKTSTETLFTFAQNTEDPTTQAEALGIFLGYFDEEEIKIATKQLTGEALDRKVIFKTYKFAKFQEKMSQIGFQVTKKDRASHLETFWGLIEWYSEYGVHHGVISDTHHCTNL